MSTYKEGYKSRSTPQSDDSEEVKRETDIVKIKELELPRTLFEEFERIVKKEDTTFQDLFRQSIKLRVRVAQLVKEPGTEIIVQHPGRKDKPLLPLIY